ncbi:helix-turn-helix domain-containing protein [Streptomyces sp. NBC_01340]|uniref:helix-turn-helix domain-containing protein n=1 Tax=unclassified Streptomyces TaxID=2593676 RepID=UPI00225C261E|nr:MULTISPECIES: helix-turn-helix transcriptional regulator [unclassified Streptomyces]MCX4456264.1 helix-turn-helix domain-containing protein [Streptomyces sp. NBC_01719]MCX4495622.1 helix-turn-helix domain-containing protein [Streptomyces sp. NBC_01728]WSI40571.1 helix-turn-helix domain-containing protein [Streptomyces sp. NBC_01340]
MGAWQPLPEELPAEVRHFVEQLRLLKDRTGMSLVALGTRTAYSKSSWQRYLNASQPPPRQAVVALCRVAGLAGEETERFGVRWELAVRAWPREPAPPVRVPAGGPVPCPGGESAPGAEVSLPAAHAAPAAHGRDGYEEDPTLPWWDLLDEESSRASREPAAPRTPRLLLYAALLAVVILLAAVVGAVTLG